MPEPSGWTRLYRMALRAYPADVRRRDGGEMERLFVDLVEGARRKRGALAAATTALRVLAEVPWSAARARRQPMVHAHPESFLAGLAGDVRVASRHLRRDPGFVVVALVTLALGSGATTAMFSVIHGALLRAPPFPDPDRLVVAYMTVTGSEEGSQRTRWSYPEFAALRASTTSFEALAAYSISDFNVTYVAGASDPVHVQGEIVSAAYTRVVGVEPTLGRTFVPEEDQAPGARPVVLLGHELWVGLYAGDPGAVGTSLDVNGYELGVIGVMPEGFRGLSGQADLWVPKAMAPFVGYREHLTDHQHFHSVVGRLRPDIGLAAAEAEVAARAVPVAASFEHEPGERWSGTVVPLARARVDREARSSQLLLFGAVWLLLAVACVNLVNLFLARAASREREVATRLALGSSAGRLMRQLLVESTIVAVAGGALGVALAYAVTGTLSTLAPARQISWVNDYGAIAPFADISIDGRVLAFALATSLGTGLLLGLVPGAGVLRRDLAGILRGGTGSRGPRRPSGRGSTLLVVSQLALTSVLLAGAGLLLATFVRLEGRDLGFDPDQVVTMWLEPAPRAYTVAEAPAFLERILDRVGTLPGVEHASVSLCTPLMSTCANTVLTLPPAPGAAAGQDVPVGRHYVGPDHFETLGVPLVRGRALTAEDRAGRPRVAVISETAARRLWPGEDPLARTFWLDESASFGPDSAYEVVGVVGDVQYGPIDAQPMPEIYASYLQFTWPYTYLFVRSALPAEQLVPEVREAVASVDPSLPLYDVRTLRARLAESLGRPRFNATLAAAFALVALALAMVGIHGVMAHYVAERRKEVGIRMALGARAPRVVGIVLRRGLAFVAAGALLGILATLALGRVMASFLFGVRPSDPSILAATVGVLAIAACVSCWVPARRASRVDPVQVLKAE